MVQQNNYKTDYNGIDMTPHMLRSLADLLEQPSLPTDPLTIVALEQLGYVVDFETGEIRTVEEPEQHVGHVSDLTPLETAHATSLQLFTLLDVLKTPGVSLCNNEKLLHWSDTEKFYILQDFHTNSTARFRSCAPALSTFIGGGKHDA